MSDFISRNALLDDLKWLKSVVNESNKNDVQDFIDRVENFPSVNEWIPVTERLPEYGQEVIVYSGNVLKPVVYGVHYWNKEFNSWAHITHWMPLPEPPMNVEGKE